MSLVKSPPSAAESQLSGCTCRNRYGYVSSSDVAAVDESAPICAFAWHFVTKRQLELLTVVSSRVTAYTAKPLGAKPAPAVEGEDTLQHELTPALEFLRLSNRLLVSLLTADQKSQFIHLLSTSQKAQQLLQVDELRTLGQFGKGTVQPDGNTSTTSEQASDGSLLIAPDIYSTDKDIPAGETCQAAIGTVNRPRRRKTAPGQYRELSSD